MLLSPACQERAAEKPAPLPPQAQSSAPIDVPSPAPPADAGEWTDSVRFRLRVLGVAPCDKPGDTERFRLGVRVEIAATQDATISPVVVSPQAAALVKDGKNFQALLNPRSTPACEGPLAHQRLGPGQSAHGVFIFEAPNDSYLKGALFRFQPPRWGGEVPLEVRLPDCFGDDCGDAGAP